MTLRRYGLATALVAITALPACGMWHSMTDRISGRTARSDTAMRDDVRTQRDGPRAPTEARTMPGDPRAPMPGTAGTAGTMADGTTARPMPGMGITGTRAAPSTVDVTRMGFRTYNECRVWFAGTAESRAANRGPLAGGEVTLADTDPCARLPRS